MFIPAETLPCTGHGIRIPLQQLPVPPRDAGPVRRAGKIPRNKAAEPGTGRWLPQLCFTASISRVIWIRKNKLKAPGNAVMDQLQPPRSRPQPPARGAGRGTRLPLPPPCPGHPTAPRCQAGQGARRPAIEARGFIRDEEITERPHRRPAARRGRASKQPGTVPRPPNSSPRPAAGWDGADLGQSRFGTELTRVGRS